MKVIERDGSYWIVVMDGERGVGPFPTDAAARSLITAWEIAGSREKTAWLNGQIEINTIDDDGSKFAIRKCGDGSISCLASG